MTRSYQYLIITGLLLLLGLGAPVAAAGPLTGWTYDPLEITIPAGSVTEPLDNFPVMIKLDRDSGANGADLRGVLAVLGSDANRKRIAVATADGTLCPVEIAEWSTADRRAVLWVKVPRIEPDQDTKLYLYFDPAHAEMTQYVGDTGEPAAQQVWSNGYAGVWLMKPNGGRVLDSTANGNHGTIYGATATQGPTGTALAFDGVNDRVIIPHDPSLSTPTALTVDMLTQMTTPSGEACAVLSKGGTPGGTEWMNYISSSGTSVDFYSYNSAGVSRGSLTYAQHAIYDGVWRYYAVTTDVMETHTYLNGGSSRSQGVTNAPQEIGGAGSDIYIGYGWGNYAQCSVSFTAISSIVRSPAWIAAQNAVLHDTFVTYTYDGYIYYQTIGYAACDQETYQQDIVVHRTTGTAYEETDGGLKIWHIYVGDHCREDYGDVRFTDSTGAELAYYLWPDYSSESARFTVRLEGATSAGVTQIHYWNPTATTTSDGDAAFHLFDHFDGTAIDTRKWDVIRSTGLSVSGGELRASKKTEIISRSTVPSNILIQFRIQSRTYYTSIGFGNADLSGTGSSIGLVYFPNYESAIYSGPPTSNRWAPPRVGTASSTDGDVIPSPPTGYYTEEFVIPEGGKLKERRNGGEWTVSTRYSGVSGPKNIQFYHGGGYAAAALDYILVRTYSATPPAALTFSGERETASPPFTAFTATPITDLAPLTVQFTDLSGGRPTSWHWDFGDGRTSTEQNPTHTYASPGTYTITLTATNEYGSTSFSQTLRVGPPSSVSFTYTVDGPELATGVPIHFQGLISSDATSWRWYFGDGATSEERNPTHTYSKTGTYRVTLTATNEYGSISFSQNLHVFTGNIADPTPPPTHGAAFRWDPETGYYTSYWFNREGSFIDVHGLFFALMLPLTQIFGSWVFLIIWGTLCMGLYLYTQDTTMPFIVGILGGSMMAFLMGEDALVVMLLTMAFAGGGILAKVLLGRV